MEDFAREGKSKERRLCGRDGLFERGVEVVARGRNDGCAEEV